MIMICIVICSKLWGKHIPCNGEYIYNIHIHIYPTYPKTTHEIRGLFSCRMRHPLVERWRGAFLYLFFFKVKVLRWTKRCGFNMREWWIPRDFGANRSGSHLFGDHLRWWAVGSVREGKKQAHSPKMGPRTLRKTKGTFHKVHACPALSWQPQAMQRHLYSPDIKVDLLPHPAKQLHQESSKTGLC